MIFQPSFWQRSCKFKIRYNFELHELRIRTECNLPLGGDLDQLEKRVPSCIVWLQKKKKRKWKKGVKSRSLGSKFKSRQRNTVVILCKWNAPAASDPRASKLDFFETQYQVMPLCLSPEQMCYPADEDCMVNASSSFSHNGNVWMFPLTNEVLPLFENSKFWVLLLHAVFRGWFSLYHIKGNVKCVSIYRKDTTKNWKSALKDGWLRGRVWQSNYPCISQAVYLNTSKTTFISE